MGSACSVRWSGRSVGSEADGYVVSDPWWIFTTCRLIYAIKRDYKFTYLGLLRASPRFGIMIFCMLLSIVFLLTDVVVTIARVTQSSGINPYWRVSFLVLKC